MREAGRDVIPFALTNPWAIAGFDLLPEEAAGDTARETASAVKAATQVTGSANPQPSALIKHQPSALNPQPSTLNPNPSTRTPQHEPLKGDFDREPGARRPGPSERERWRHRTQVLRGRRVM